MFNWIDIFIVCVILRYIYVARKCEFIPELFNLSGILFATFLGIHYYIKLNLFIVRYLLIPKSLGDFFAFSLIVVFVLLIFILIREGWLIILKIKMHPFIDKSLGMISSFVRGYLICGAIFFAFTIVHNERFNLTVDRSFSSKAFKSVSVNVYRFFYTTFIQKFFSNESFNNIVFKKSANDIRRARRERRAKRVKREE